MRHHDRIERGLLGAAIAGAFALAVGGAAPPPTTPTTPTAPPTDTAPTSGVPDAAPADAKTPAQAKAAVAELARVKNKRQQMNELRREYPAPVLAPVLAEALVEAITSDPAFASDAQTRIAAYEGLASVGDRSAGEAVLASDKQIDQLVAGLKESDAVVRRICAGVLGRVIESRRQSVADPLAGVLDDPSPPVTQQALGSLAKLRIKCAVPKQVGVIAFEPTEAMRARWTTLDAQRAAAKGTGAPQELSVRELAMNVVIAWEGTEALVDRDLSKDETGRNARAVAIGRRALNDKTLPELDERRYGVVIGELAQVLKQPGELREADRGAALVLFTIAQKGKPEGVKQAAKDALRDAAETAPESKRASIREALAKLK